MKVGFIGTGNMGGALASAASRTGAEIYLFDKDTDKAKSLADTLGARAVCLSDMRGCDFIFLGVKPNIISSVAEEISSVISGTDTVIVSMAAGVKTESIEASLPCGTPVIRIMPNTPVAYGEGMILYTANKKLTADTKSAFESLMREAGKLDETDEKLIDAASAISGCGPAFAYMFLEALADGGVAAGLPRDKALAYAAQMLLGSARALLESGQHPIQMKDAVCSPGGSTIEGVMTLEECGFCGIVSDAVIAAYEKTKLLGK